MSYCDWKREYVKKEYSHVDYKTQIAAKEAAAKVGGEEFVMDLKGGYQVVNVVDWEKAEKTEAELGNFFSLQRSRKSYDCKDYIEWIYRGCPGKDANGNIKFYDANGKAFQIYAVYDEKGNPSATMLIREGALQEFRVKEPSAENLSHVRKVAKNLNKANQKVICDLWIDDKGNSKAPKGFVIKNVPDLYGYSSTYIGQRLGRIPVKDGAFPDFSQTIAECSFDVSNYEIDSLDGMPQEIHGHFDCSHNELKSLEGGPKVVCGTYDCSHNPIMSYKGIPTKLDGDFIYPRINYYKLYDKNNKSYGTANCWVTERLHAKMPSYEETWKIKLRRELFSQDRGSR